MARYDGFRRPKTKFGLYFWRFGRKYQWRNQREKRWQFGGFNCQHWERNVQNLPLQRVRSRSNCTLLLLRITQICPPRMPSKMDQVQRHQKMWIVQISFCNAGQGKENLNEIHSGSSQKIVETLSKIYRKAEKNYTKYISICRIHSKFSQFKKHV